MRKFLLTWYGITDFRASLGLENTEGPIAAALAAENYSDVVILCYTRPDNGPDECRELQESFAAELSAIRDTAQPSDWDTTRKLVSKYANTTIAHEHFASWLRAKFQKPDGSLQLSFKSETLRELNDTEGIYACAMRALDLVAQEPGEKLVTLYLSPGTPVMAFVWAIAALAHPTLTKRLIASPVIGKPPATIALPSEWLERHGHAKTVRQARSEPFDVTFHLFGEQRMPALLGIRQFESTSHVFVNSPDYPATCMRQFVNGECDELPVNPWDPAAVRERIIHRVHTLPSNARIAVNLTGGTKLMFAGALAAARAVGGIPYYINRRNRCVVFVDDFHREALKPIEAVQTFVNLHGDGLTLSRAGETAAFPPDRNLLSETLWKKSGKLAERYQYILPYRNTTDPFQFDAAGFRFTLDAHHVASVVGSGIHLRFDNWPDFANYLTGGWFEEYVFLLLKPYETAGVIKDLRLNMELDMNSSEGRHTRWKSTYNELDIVFTDGCSLYIVECKAGNVTQEQVMKLQNIVRFYGGTGGRGIVASCFKPQATAEKKIIDARLFAVYGKTLPAQLNDLMKTISATHNSDEARA